MAWSDRTDVQLRSLGQHVQSNTLRAGRYILRLTNKGATYATAVWYSTDGGSKWMELSVSVAGVGFKEVVIQNQTRRPILIDDSDIHGDTDMELTIQEIPLNAEPFLGIQRKSGLFTPTITITTPGDLAITYSQQKGFYKILDDICYFTAYIDINTISHTTASGDWRFSLPFTALNELYMHHVIPYNFRVLNRSVNSDGQTMRIEPNHNYANIMYCSDNSAWVYGTNANLVISNTNKIEYSGIYRISI